MGSIGSFLSGFTGSFKAALLLWPLLSFMLTLPILVYLYHRDGRLRLASFIAAYLAVLYIAGLGCFTLYPLPSGDSGLGISYGIAPQLNPFAFISDIAKDGLKAIFQLLFNIVLFLPLGFIAKHLLRLNLPKTAIAAFLTTLLIETAQLTGFFGLYPFAYRTFDVDDIIFNTLGGIAGWWCAAGFERLFPAPKAEEPTTTHSPGFVRRGVALWVDACLIGIIACAPWLIIALSCELMFDRPFTLPGLDAMQTEWLFVVIDMVLAFAIIEGIIPWLNDGSTPGGALVHMSFETVPRTGWKRLGFYAVRTLTVALLLAMPAFFVIPVAIFYLFARKMPYDCLPAST